MAELTDIGGGFKQFTGGGSKQGGELEQLNQVLGLKDLAQRIHTGSLDQQLKQAQIDRLPREQELSELELRTKQIGEKDAQIGLTAKTIELLPQLYATNPAAADLAAKQAFGGGASIVPGADGLFELQVDRGDGGDPFRIGMSDRKIVKPETRSQFERDYAKTWQQISEPAAEASQNFSIAEAIARDTPSAQGDVAFTQAIMKTMNPRVQFKSNGQIENMTQIGDSIPSALVTKLNQAITNNAPSFEADQREAYLNAARRYVGGYQKSALQFGASIYKNVGQQGLDQGAVFTRSGGITPDVIKLAAEKGIDEALKGIAPAEIKLPRPEGSNNNKRSQVFEKNASVLEKERTGRQPGASAPAQKSRSFTDSLMGGGQ